MYRISLWVTSAYETYVYISGYEMNLMSTRWVCEALMPHTARNFTVGWRRYVLIQLTFFYLLSSGYQGLFFGSKAAGAWSLTTRLQPRSRMRGAIPPLSHYASVWCSKHRGDFSFYRHFKYSILPQSALMCVSLGEGCWIKYAFYGLPVCSLASPPPRTSC
jgi:hypothetical protein